MKELDLHGVRHEHVELQVENFLLWYCNGSPVKVITGNSPFMRAAVEKIAQKHGFRVSVENHYNLGSLIVSDL